MQWSAVLSLMAARPSHGSNQYGLAPWTKTIEMLWIQDVSKSFEPHLSKLNEGFAVAMDDFKHAFEHSRFGVATFTDKPLHPYGSAVSGDYCYKLKYRLSRYTDRVTESVNKTIVRSGADLAEAQLHAMLNGAVSDETKWGDNKTPNGYKINKFMFLVTDSPYHIAGDTSLPPNEGKGKDDCLTNDYPTEDQVVKALNARKITPIFLVDRKVTSLYWEFVQRFEQHGFVIETDDWERINIRDTLRQVLQDHFEPNRRSATMIPVIKERNAEAK